MQTSRKINISYYETLKFYILKGENKNERQKQRLVGPSSGKATQ